MFFILLLLQPVSSTLFPYTTLFRSKNINIFDAISMSNGITDYADLTKLLVVRKTNGTSHTYKVDATSKDIYSSERSEEHTSELQSREKLVCRLLLEKKKDIHVTYSR